MFRSLILAACMGLMSAAAQACSTTTPCTVASGDYYVALPDITEAAPPAVVFVHGFGGSGSGVFRNTGMVGKFLARGYVVIAPHGLRMQGRNGGSWSFHPERPQRRDEVAFLSDVKADAVARLGVDPERVVLAGFSIGGSMASYYACANPNGFAAYAPTGGSFWRPHPTECAGPVRVLHTHGWTDGTVPLEGRILGGPNRENALVQGDVFLAFDIWRRTNNCTHHAADRFVTSGPFWRRAWDRCENGSALELALFPGGHIIHRDWPDLVVDWFEGLLP